jgi:hypothetical protein
MATLKRKLEASLDSVVYCSRVPVPFVYFSYHEAHQTCTIALNDLLTSTPNLCGTEILQ